VLTEYSAARSYFGLLLVPYWMIGPQVIEILEGSTKFLHASGARCSEWYLLMAARLKFAYDHVKDLYFQLVIAKRPVEL
jgi:hypothetical protein